MVELKPNVLTAIAVVALVLSAIGAGAGIMALASPGVEGPEGPEGPAGDTGAAGPQGEPGYGFASFVIAAHDSLDNENADFVCDGVDDQVQIDEALEALPEQGGSIYLREGTYLLSDGLSISRSNVTIGGSGPGTVLKVEDDLNGTMTVMRAQQVSRIVIEDLRIDGNKASNVEGDHHGIVFDRCYESRISGVQIEDLRGTAVEFSSSSMVILEGSVIRDCVTFGVWVNYSTGISVLDNQVQRCDDVSVFLALSRDCVVRGNQVSFGGLHSLYMSLSNYNVIEGNCLKGAVVNGVYLDSSYYNTISGNQVLSSGWWGIYVSTSSNNNILVGNTVSSSLYDGVRIDGSTGNSLTGNAILDSGWAGLIVYDSDDTAVSGNVVDSCFYSCISIYSSDQCIISGNTVRWAQEHGIMISSSDDCVISGNTVSCNSFRVSNSYSGIYIAGDSDTNLIDGNTVRIGYTDFKQRYGLYIQSSFCNNNLVINNDLYVSGWTADFIDDGSGTIYHNNRLSTGWTP